MKEDLEDRNFEIPIKNLGAADACAGLHWLDRMLLKLHDLIYLVYELAYFHFFPYLVFTVIHLWKNVKATGLPT